MLSLFKLFGEKEDMFTSMLTEVYYESLPYINEKPGGTDIGHLVKYGNEELIIKTGMNMSLIGQAVSKYSKSLKNIASIEAKIVEILKIENSTDTQEQINKLNAELVAAKDDKFISSKKYFSFIVGNFLKIVKDNSKTSDGWKAEETRLKNAIFEPFEKFVNTEFGKSLIKNINLNKKYKVTLDDITKIYTFFATNDDGSLNNDVINIIGLSLFADTVTGNFSQKLNNDYQRACRSNAPIAEQNYLILKDKSAPKLLMASTLIRDADNKIVPGLDEFLLEPFLSKKEEFSSNPGLWINEAMTLLKDKIGAAPIYGLTLSTMIRFVLGENADNGPDNMLMIKKNNEWHIVNIDLTGFRYPRSENFDIKNKEGVTTATVFGWKHIFDIKDQTEQINAIFSKDVFKARFVDDNEGLSNVSKEAKQDIYNAIVALLKEKLQPNFDAEFNKSMDWAANIDAVGLIENLNKATREAYNSLSDLTKFNEVYLDKLLKFNSKFITEFHDYASERASKRIKLEDSAISRHKSPGLRG